MELPISYVRQPDVTSEEFTYLHSILIPSQLRPASVRKLIE